VWSWTTRQPSGRRSRTTENHASAVRRAVGEVPAPEDDRAVGADGVDRQDLEGELAHRLGILRVFRLVGVEGRLPAAPDLAARREDQGVLAGVAVHVRAEVAAVPGGLLLSSTAAIAVRSDGAKPRLVAQPAKAQGKTTMRKRRAWSVDDGVVFLAGVDLAEALLVALDVLLQRLQQPLGVRAATR
jgi:hypothetical protein